MHPALNKRIQLELRISRLEAAFCLAVDNYFFQLDLVNGQQQQQQ